MKILVVEDDSDIRRLYAIGLNQRGFEVKLAANGAEAVDRIHAEQPDLIVLDWIMPLMDGGEVLDRIESGLGQMIPVIVVSGQVFPPDSQPDRRVGHWLTKPVAIDDLVREIERIVPGLDPTGLSVPSGGATQQIG